MAGSQRHPDDIRAMLRVSRADLEGDALCDWLERMALVDDWRLVQPNHRQSD